jgi:hypothetical protein
LSIALGSRCGTIGELRSEMDPDFGTRVLIGV